MSSACINRFVILAAPRSGSNMLCCLLNSHPEILCHHELYNPQDIYYALNLRHTGFKLASCIRQRDEQPLKFLEKIWACNNHSKNVGFKMTHKQNLLVFNTLLNDRSIKKIVLLRNNKVKMHVSKLIAEQNGIWENYGQEPTNNIQVNIDLLDLQKDIFLNKVFYNEINKTLTQSNQTYLQVEYEKLQQSDTQNAILDYLQLPHKTLTSTSKKQNSVDLRQLISNFSSLLNQCKTETLKQQLLDREV